MQASFIQVILAVLIAGTAGFGGGIGAVNTLTQFALDSGWAMDDAGIMRIAAISQYSGYSQGIIVSAYIGSFYGIIHAVICAAAYILPSVFIVVLIFKISGRFYKNEVFGYCLKYINLLSVGYIAVTLTNFIFAVFAIDPIFFLAFAGLACYANIAFNVSPALITLAGAVIGLIFRWGWQ